MANQYNVNIDIVPKKESGSLDEIHLSSPMPTCEISYDKTPDVTIVKVQSTTSSISIVHKALDCIIKIYQEIRSCFGSGLWYDDREWLDDENWLDN